MRQALTRGCSKACRFWLFLYTVSSCAGLKRLTVCTCMFPFPYLDLSPLFRLPPSGPLLFHRRLDRFPVGCYFPVLSASSVYLLCWLVYRSSWRYLQRTGLLRCFFQWEASIVNSGLVKLLTSRFVYPILPIVRYW